MKRLLLALLFGAAGFLLNAQSYPVWRNVELFFGSVASLASAVLLGPWWGGLTALLAFSPVGMSTGRLFEVPAFVLEAFVVGLLVHRKQVSVVASVAIYWLIAAIWMSILLALFTLQEPSAWLGAGALAYPLGSLISAVFLEFLFILIPLEKPFGRPAAKGFQHVLFILLAGFVLAPALVITYRLGKSSEQNAAKRLEREMLQAAGARTGLLDLSSIVRKGVGQDEALPFVYRAESGELPWQLLLISSKSSFDRELQAAYFGYFAAVLVSLGIAFGLSHVVARKYTRIREVDTLLQDFQSTRGSLEQSRDRLRQSLKQVEEQKLQGARAYDELQRTLAQLRATQSQLLQAEKLAALGEMLRRIAHELNNPLTAVIGYSELMLKYGVERSDENLQTILSQGQRCKEIIRALLEFSRQSESVRGPVSLAEVLEKVRSLVEHQFAVRDMEFEIMIPRDLPLILADPQKLVQVFLNLANNAYDALEQQTETPRRFSVGAYQSGDSVYVVVSDTGAGIPASIRDKIFDPFFTTKPVGKGTGLGLSAVYGILKEHNAEIRCESEPGEGTQFFIRLPVISSVTEEVAAGAIAIAAPAGSVLIVDDEKSILNLVQEYLESAGYAVRTCENGLEALHCLQRDNYDLLITDLWMPGMSGFELYEWCRSSSGLKNLKVLFISGDPDEEVRAKIEGLSAHFVSKPFTRSELLSNVFGLLIS